MLKPISLFRSFLDYEFRPNKSTKCRIVESPGKWMSEENWGQLLQDITTVSKRCKKGQDLEYGVIKNDSVYRNNSIITIIYDTEQNVPIAFNAMSYLDIELPEEPNKVIHLGLVMVDPEYRKKGLSWMLYGLTCVLLFVRKLFTPIWVSSVSQVPSVVGAVEDAYENVYPSFQNPSRRSFQHALIANKIMKNCRAVFGVGDDARFDNEQFIIKNSYTGGSDGLKKTFEETSKHRADSVNQACITKLNYERGDDFLQVGQINLTALKKYVFRKVPKESKFKFIINLIFIFIISILLPTVRWYKVNQQMGSIRPRGGA